VQFLTNILARFRVGIHPLRIRIRSEPKNGDVGSVPPCASWTHRRGSPIDRRDAFGDCIAVAETAAGFAVLHIRGGR
jgi:hypothetical protein